MRIKNATRLAFIDYSINNYCSMCELEYSKLLGTKCPQCGHQARTLPRNPKVFKDSQIWKTRQNY